MKKNRKFFGCLIAIIALLCLGIGYASLNGELIIGGTIGTTSVDNLGNNRIYFVAAEDATLADENIVKLETSLVNKDSGTSPDYTGAQVNGYTDGYTKSTITVSDFSQVNTAFAKYTIVSFQESTNNVVIGYEVDLSYADSSININDYFEVLGRFTTYEVNSPSGSGYSLDSTIEISPDTFVYFWVSVSMKKVPPVALSGVSITITLTYNAK